MTWIRTTPLPGDEDALLQAMQAQRALYPKEYSAPNNPGGDSIVSAHALMPQALFHVFASFGAMMSPDLPLSRAQHEMIATLVSITNRCFY
jgi:hypothetical protein